jgi:hypothetical protein
MARPIAKPLPLIGLGACLAAAGVSWEHAARALFVSPATLRSYANRGAPQARIVALTLLLGLPHRSSRPLFVRWPEGLGMRTAREPHRAHRHQPTLRPAEEREGNCSDGTPDVVVAASEVETTMPMPRWRYMRLPAGRSVKSLHSLLIARQVEDRADLPHCADSGPVPCSEFQCLRNQTGRVPPSSYACGAD